MPYLEKLESTITEPVSVAEAIAFARLTEADSVVVELLLPACREAIERLVGLSLVPQDYRVWFDREEIAENTWPRSGSRFGWDPDPSEMTFRAAPLGLALAPVSAIVSLKAYDGDDVETTVDPLSYSLDSAARPARLVLGSGLFAVSDLRPTRCLVAHVTAGYLTAALPAAAKLAILRTLATNAEHREDVVAGTIATRVPDVAANLLDGLRVWSLS